MTDELGREELLKYLDTMRQAWKIDMLPLIDYNPKVEEQAYQQIKALIQKPEITEAWYEEKAERFMLQCPGGMLHNWASVKRFIKDFIRSLIEEIPAKKAGVDKDWLPTAENINALPEPVRKYIHDIETNCDPASMVQENALLRDICKALEIKLEEKVQVHDELLIKYTEKFREDYERGFCSRNNYKGRLKQFSQEAGLEIVKK